MECRTTRLAVGSEIAEFSPFGVVELVWAGSPSAARNARRRTSASDDRSQNAGYTRACFLHTLDPQLESNLYRETCDRLRTRWIGMSRRELAAVAAAACVACCLGPLLGVLGGVGALGLVSTVFIGAAGVAIAVVVAVAVWLFVQRRRSVGRRAGAAVESVAVGPPTQKQ